MVPLTIIAGFLGAGKTSLLNHILTHNKRRRITALVNDFGALSIDAELIAAQEANQITLANGCVCCSINDDLAVGLAQALDASPAPDHIIIEASGVADPARIALFADVDSALRLDGIITLVDAAAHFIHARDTYLADTYRRQIMCGDFFLINKTDLITGDTLQKVQDDLRQLRPDTPQVAIQYGVYECEALLGFQKNDSPPFVPSPSLSSVPLTQKEHGLVHWSAHLPAIARAEIQDKLQRLAPHLLRAKAILQDGAGAYIIHYAGGRIDIIDYDGKPSGHFSIIGKPAMGAPDELAKHFMRQN
ncbi:MAG: GTP-binding protein [Alphaproteobacteria bacterium]|nr:GTP-binding protein [Alphaproteobacteria bacterium]